MIVAWCMNSIDMEATVTVHNAFKIGDEMGFQEKDTGFERKNQNLSRLTCVKE